MTGRPITHRCPLCGWTGTDERLCPTCGHGTVEYEVRVV